MNNRVIEENLDLSLIQQYACKYGPYGELMPTDMNFYYQYASNVDYILNLYQFDIGQARSFISDMIFTHSDLKDKLSTEFQFHQMNAYKEFYFNQTGTYNLYISDINEFICEVPGEFIKAMSVCQDISADIDTACRINDDEEENIENFILANQKSI